MAADQPLPDSSKDKEVKAENVPKQPVPMEVMRQKDPLATIPDKLKIASRVPARGVHDTPIPVGGHQRRN